MSLERRASRALELIEDGDFAVSVEELDGLIEREETIHGLARHRTWQNVAADDNPIDRGRADLGEHGRERGEVAMNVVENRDAHSENLNVSRNDTSSVGQQAIGDFHDRYCRSRP